MYHSYFGLTEPPFSIAVDPRYLYMSDRHRDALAHLVYGVGVGGGFILLTGEVGTGKTTVIRCLLEQLPDATDVALVLNPTLDARQLLATVCGELAIAADEGDLKCLTDSLHRFLLDNHQRGRNTVLLIDEAQHLDAGALEQIRLLTNLETNTKKLLQIVLVGQPELSAKLARPALRQLSQRITARFELTPLNAAETAAYIDHRLRIGGLEGPQKLFSSRIIGRIHRASGGTPRVVNIICDRALLGCYGRDQGRVDGATLRAAIAEVSAARAAALSARQSLVRDPDERWHLSAVVGLLLVTAIALVWWQIQPQRSPAAVPLDGSRRVAEPAAESGAPAPGASAKPVLQLSDWSSAEEAAAISRLLASLDQWGEPVANPCQAWAGEGLRCERLRVQSWSDLASYGTPALLELGGASQRRWVAARSVAEGSALLVGPRGERRWSQAELAKHWTGDVVLPWRAPTGYQRPLRIGSTGAAVNWLAQGFARIDGQAQGLTDQVFNALLEQRVRLFQREQSLYVDGVAGLRTVLRMQQLLEGLRPEPASVAVLGGEG